MPCISNNVIWIVLPVTWILIATRDSALHFPVQKWTVRHLKVLPPKKPKNDQIHHFPTSFSSFACFSWSNPEVEKATSFQQMGVCTQCTALEGLSAFDLNFNLFFISNFLLLQCFIISNSSRYYLHGSFICFFIEKFQILNKTWPLICVDCWLLRFAHNKGWQFWQIRDAFLNI